MPKFRPETDDESIWNSVLSGNEYHLPPQLSGDVILDIGAHIGSFTVLCSQRGAESVFAVEPCKESFKLLVENTRDCPVIPINMGVCGCGYQRTAILHHGPGPTSCSFVLHNGSGEECTLVPIRTVIESMPKLPRVVKLDCEGSEYDIVPAYNWQNIDLVIVEWHEITYFKAMYEECDNQLRLTHNADVGPVHGNHRVVHYRRKSIDSGTAD